MRLALPALLLAAALAGCASDGRSPPSLAPRAAEAIDPRLPVPDRSAALAPDAALAARLDSALERARAAAAAAEPAIAAARAAVAAAGPSGSDGWIAAQQSVSAAIAARAPFVAAMADFDRLVSARIETGGRIVPRDIAAARARAEALTALDERQAAAIDALRARLGG